MSLDSDDPLYPAVSRPASAFGEPASPQAMDPILHTLRDATTGSLAVLCPQPIHHVLEYARLYQLAERLEAHSPGAESHLWMCSELDDDSLFDRLPFETVHRLPEAGDRHRGKKVVAGLRDAGTVLLLATAGDWHESLRQTGARVVSSPPLGFRGDFFDSAAGEAAARAFQRAAGDGSPRWTLRPGAPWPITLPPAPRLLVHQARFHVGDTLWLTPLLRALRRHFPDASITVVGPPSAGEILATDPAAGEVLTDVVPFAPRGDPAGGGRRSTRWRPWLPGQGPDAAGRPVLAADSPSHPAKLFHIFLFLRFWNMMKSMQEKESIHARGTRHRHFVS